MKSRAVRAGAVAAVALLAAGAVIFAGQSAPASSQSNSQPTGRPAPDPSAKTYATYCNGCHDSGSANNNKTDRKYEKKCSDEFGNIFFHNSLF